MKGRPIVTCITLVLSSSTAFDRGVTEGRCSQVCKAGHRGVRVPYIPYGGHDAS